MEVQLHRRSEPDVEILDVRGELDISTSPRLRSAIQEVLASGRSHLVVNLLHTTYLDSTALSVLTSALKQARDAGGTVALVYNQPQIEKIFTITGLHEIFAVYRSEPEAVNAARAGLADRRSSSWPRGQDR
ncbi:MAG TPA: STAS domain-containing protein [bacterium]|nr:STAS domain-containing protein [bacterium]